MYEYRLKFAWLPLPAKASPIEIYTFFSANRHKTLSLIKLHISSRIWDFLSLSLVSSTTEKASKKYRNQHQTLLQSTNLCLKKINLLELRFNEILLRRRKKRSFKFVRKKDSSGIFQDDDKLKRNFQLPDSAGSQRTTFSAVNFLPPSQSKIRF